MTLQAKRARGRGPLPAAQNMAQATHTCVETPVLLPVMLWRTWRVQKCEVSTPGRAECLSPFTYGSRQALIARSPSLGCLANLIREYGRVPVLKLAACAAAVALGVSWHSQFSQHVHDHRNMGAHLKQSSFQAALLHT